MSDSIYFDYNATTPLKPAVIALMQDVMSGVGNASSVHSYGRAARRHVETARERVAALAGVLQNQVVFTSGATESNNAVLKTFAGKRILVSAIEHPSVRVCLENVEYIPVTKDGVIDLTAFEKMLDGTPPALISVMMVNNETGVIQPVAELAKIARKKCPGVFIHTDAVQAMGRVRIDFPALYVDYLSLSAHKGGGPQGAGAIIVAPGAPPAKILHGGGQEKMQRAGTENVAGISGFGMAAMLALSDMEQYQRLAAWREKMEETLVKFAPGIKVFGRGVPRVANTTALCCPAITAETQLMNLDLAGIAVSSGSACSSGSFKPSSVLKAMGANDTEAFSTLRISAGWNTSERDYARFTETWAKMYQRLAAKAFQPA